MKNNASTNGNLYEATAGYYDLDNRDIIKDDLSFYLQYAQRTAGPILELASGTGRVSLFLAEQTQRLVDCVELSETMLAQFEKKLRTSHKYLKDLITLHRRDMADFQFTRTYDYVLIPWRALQWLPEESQAISCLRCVKAHLSPGGIFIMDIFKPRQYDESWLGVESVSYDVTSGDERITRSTINQFFDNEKKYIQYLSRYRIQRGDEETTVEDLMTVKYYEREDMRAILEGLGFRVLEEFGYYDKRSIDDGEDMIFVCAHRR